MSVPTLRTVTRLQGNNRALKDGTVCPAGFELDFVEVPVLVSAFRRMVRNLEFDVCEMAITTYLCAREHGVAFTAIPVPLVRGFHHGAIVCRRDSGIQHPADLEGRRVGVSRGYTVTTGVWARGILAKDYGVRLDRVTWVLSGDEHVETYTPPDNVVAARGSSPDLSAMLLAGEIDAVVGAAIEESDAVQPLIADAAEAAFSALETRGLYPINHVVVIRNDVLEAFPTVATSVFDAFAEAKRLYVAELCGEGIKEPTSTDRMYARVLDVTGADPLPYGVNANRAMLAELIDHAMRQQILETEPTVDELFAASTRDLSA
jgi:4,5-dihydroxyphthalate decarboxylase